MPGREPDGYLGEPEDWPSVVDWSDVETVFIKDDRLTDDGQVEVWIDDQKFAIEVEHLADFDDFIDVLNGVRRVEELDYDIDIAELPDDRTDIDYTHYSPKK